MAKYPWEIDQQVQGPEAELKRVQAQNELDRIRSGKADEPKDELATKKKSALAAVTQLEELYGTEGSTNLALAPSSDILGKGIGKIGELGRKLDPKYSEDLNIFKSALSNVAGVFTQAFGSGTPQEAEARRFLENAPGPNSTDAEAKAWFDNVKVFLGKEPEKTTESSSASLPKEPPKLSDKAKKFVGNIITNEREIGEGIGKTILGVGDIANKIGPFEFVKNPEEGLKAWGQLAMMPLNAALGILDEAYQVVGSPGQGGGVSGAIERAGKRAYEKPVSTALDLLPALGPIKSSQLKTMPGQTVEEFVKSGLGSGKASVTKLLPKTPPDLGGVVVKAGEKIESMTPKSFLGRKQAEAAQKYSGVKVDNDSLLETGNKLSLSDPDVAREFSKQKTYIKNIKDVPQLLERMQAWGKTAYLKSGGIKSAAKAQLYDALYRTGTVEHRQLGARLLHGQRHRLCPEHPEQAHAAGV
jgi:hypothetical protein